MPHAVSDVKQSNVVNFPKQREGRFVWKDQILESNLGANARLVAFVLVEYFGLSKSDVCWPGIAKIVEKSRLSERTVQRTLRELEAAGFLVDERPGGGLKRTGRYRLQLLPF